ncbi:hypothetical protein BH24GEM3_BH24GEM3_24960 [soil metagenome]
MALDEALMHSVRAGAPPVLRFYRWTPRCLSLGRNQPGRDRYDLERLAARGTEVVRRPTGGRAVLHDRELTYSVIAMEGVLGSPRESYAAINRALAAGLRRLGVPAALQPRGSRAPVPSLSPCFREPAEGEVVAGGRKLIGSAQYREGGVMLQHGSLLLEDDQGEVREYPVGPTAPPPPNPLPQFWERGNTILPSLGSCPTAGSAVLPSPEFGGGAGGGGAHAVLRDFCDPLPSWDVLTAALAAGWEEELWGSLRPDEPSAAERACAERLAAHYADAAWTWRL